MILISLLAALGGCNSAEKAAEYAATRGFVDPETARFRNVRINHEGVVCGEVSGKDAKGADTGFRKYIYFTHTGNFAREPASVDDALVKRAAALCNASVGTQRARTVCSSADRLWEAQRALSDFRFRYGVDCS